MRLKGGVEPQANVKRSGKFQMVSEAERCNELLQGRQARSSASCCCVWRRIEPQARSTWRTWAGCCSTPHSATSRPSSRRWYVVWYGCSVDCCPPCMTSCSCLRYPRAGCDGDIVRRGREHGKRRVRTDCGDAADSEGDGGHAEGHGAVAPLPWDSHGGVELIAVLEDETIRRALEEMFEPTCSSR